MKSNSLFSRTQSNSTKRRVIDHQALGQTWSARRSLRNRNRRREKGDRRKWEIPEEEKKPWRFCLIKADGDSSVVPIPQRRVLHFSPHYYGDGNNETGRFNRLNSLVEIKKICPSQIYLINKFKFSSFFIFINYSRKTSIKLLDLSCGRNSGFFCHHRFSHVNHVRS